MADQEQDEFGGRSPSPPPPPPDILDVHYIVSDSQVLGALWINLALGGACLFGFVVLRGWVSGPGGVFQRRQELQDLFMRPPRLVLGTVRQIWNWLAPLLAVSDADIVRCAGFDALVLTRVMLLGLQMFTVMSLLGVGVLIPAYRSQDNLHEVEASSGSLATITVANISPGSNFFLLPFFFTYIFTVYCCAVLWVNNMCYTQLRLAYFQCMDVLPPEAALEGADKGGAQTPAGARTPLGTPSAGLELRTLPARSRAASIAAHALGAASEAQTVTPGPGAVEPRPRQGPAPGPGPGPVPGPLGEATEPPQPSPGAAVGLSLEGVELTVMQHGFAGATAAAEAAAGSEAAAAGGPHRPGGAAAGPAAHAEGYSGVAVPEMAERSIWFNAANFVAPPLRMMLDHLDWMGPLQRAAAVFGLRNLRLPMIHDDQAPPNARLYGKDEDMLGWDRQSLAVMGETPEGRFKEAGVGDAAIAGLGPEDEPRGQPAQLPAVLPYWRPATVLSSLKPGEGKLREEEASLPLSPTTAPAAFSELRRRPTALRAVAAATAAAAAATAGLGARAGGGGGRSGAVNPTSDGGSDRGVSSSAASSTAAGPAGPSAAVTPGAYAYLRHANSSVAPIDDIDALQASVVAAARAAAAPIKTDRELLSDTSQPLYPGKVNARTRQLLRVPLPPPPEDVVPTSMNATSAFPRTNIAASTAGHGQAFIPSDAMGDPSNTCTRLVNARHFVVLIRKVHLQRGPSPINRMAALAYVIVSSLRSGMTFAAAKAAAAAANVGSAMHRRRNALAKVKVSAHAREDAESEGAAEAEVRAARATTVKGKNKAIHEVLRYYSMFRFGQSERDFLEAASARTAAPAAARGLATAGGSMYTPAGSIYGTPGAGSSYSNSRFRVTSSASPQLPSRLSASPGPGPVAEAAEAPDLQPATPGSNGPNPSPAPVEAPPTLQPSAGNDEAVVTPAFSTPRHEGPVVQAVKEAQAAMDAADARAEEEVEAEEDPNGSAVAHVIRTLYPRSFLGLVPVVDHGHVDNLITAWDTKMIHLATAVRELRLAQARLLDHGDVESGGKGESASASSKAGQPGPAKAAGATAVAAGGRPGPCGDRLPGFRSVEAIRESISELREQVTELEGKIEAARAEALAKPIGTAYFAMFNDALDAQMLAQCPRVIPPRGPGTLISFEATSAPAPDDVYWPALWSTDELSQFWRRIAIFIPMGIIFLIPIGALQGALANLNIALCAGKAQPQQTSPPLASAQGAPLQPPSSTPIAAANDIYLDWFCNPDTFWEKLANSLLTGVLPSVLGLVWGAVIMPQWFHMCSSISRRSTSLSAMEREMQTWWFWYSLVNTFLGAMMGGGFLGQLGTYLSNPTNLLTRLGTAVPTTANFFIQFVIARALMTNCMRLIWPHAGSMLGAIFRSLLRLLVPRSLHQAAVLHMIPTSRAAGWYNGIVQVFMFGFAFAVVAPLILPCCCFFFFTGFFAYRYCILYVFERGYESGGRMWPVLFDQMMGFLVLMELFSGAVLFVNGSFTLAIIMWSTLTPPLAFFWHFNRHRYLLPLHHPPLSLVAREPVGAAVDPLVYTPPALRPGAIGWYPEQGKVWEKYGIPRHCC
ncbi:hypothetical protein HYH03_012109 [Edaphochlamys debaryana]|uniref:ERD4-related membrane protein n=1 Tax=Edaphochlamys debaryana TaxID=47281 RepID=A0A835XUX9_9CHLO|nr:hypothetical protein HYH03_012109 [Edaphochlamys debaryana]|eukprot:KAG2489473.1 hypothetical protein HYH03_012109 [Edaphochlamys debaryana]